MTAIQTKIMQVVERWAKKFESARPAGEDAVIFKAGTRKVTIRYITQIDFYQVIAVQEGVPFINDIGVREQGLSSYFSANEMACAA